ncbi:hypothetical protein GN956_G15728 [Arapaima gigas]
MSCSGILYVLPAKLLSTVTPCVSRPLQSTGGLVGLAKIPSSWSPGSRPSARLCPRLYRPPLGEGSFRLRRDAANGRT